MRSGHGLGRRVVGLSEVPARCSTGVESIKATKEE